MMTRFEQVLVWSATALIAITGTVYGAMKYLMATEDPYAVINHPWQPFFLKAHVLTAPLLVFAVGVIFSKHVWKRWRSDNGSGRRSGGSVLVAAAPLVLSGYLIQTVTAEPLLSGIALAHIGLGVVFIAAILAHQVLAAVRKRRRHDAEAARNSN